MNGQSAPESTRDSRTKTLEVRHGLAKLRTIWNNSSPFSPMNISTTFRGNLPNDDGCEVKLCDFALELLLTRLCSGHRKGGS